MNVAAIRANYAAFFTRRGESVAIRRYAGTGATRPYQQADTIAVLSGFAPDELVGVIVQSDRKVLVLTQPLIDAQFPLPLRKDDKLVHRNKEFNIEAPDSDTRCVAGEVIAYELRVRG